MSNVTGKIVASDGGLRGIMVAMRNTATTATKAPAKAATTKATKATTEAGPPRCTAPKAAAPKAPAEASPPSATKALGKSIAKAVSHGATRQRHRRLRQLTPSLRPHRSTACGWCGVAAPVHHPQHRGREDGAGRDVVGSGTSALPFRQGAGHQVIYDAGADAAATSGRRRPPPPSMPSSIAFTAAGGQWDRHGPHTKLHDVCDPNQLFKPDICEDFPETDDGDDFYRLVALANRITDTYDTTITKDAIMINKRDERARRDRQHLPERVFKGRRVHPQGEVDDDDGATVSGLMVDPDPDYDSGVECFRVGVYSNLTMDDEPLVLLDDIPTASAAWAVFGVLRPTNSPRAPSGPHGRRRWGREIWPDVRNGSDFA